MQNVGAMGRDILGLRAVKFDQILVVGNEEDMFGCFGGADWGEGLRGHTSFLPSGHSSGGVPEMRNKDPHSRQQGLLQKIFLMKTEKCDNYGPELKKAWPATRPTTMQMNNSTE